MQVGQRDEGDDLNSEINVTPFVDVMLVLLVIFMITAPMMNTGVDIALPQVEAENVEEAKGKIILSIGMDRRLSLSLAEGGRAPVTWADLADKVKFNDKLQRQGELYVEAHKDLPYGVVVTAMAIARNAGVEKVMLLTDPGEHIDPAVLDAEAAKAAPNSGSEDSGGTEGEIEE